METAEACRLRMLLLLMNDWRGYIKGALFHVVLDPARRSSRVDIENHTTKERDTKTKVVYVQLSP